MPPGEERSPCPTPSLLPFANMERRRRAKEARIAAPAARGAVQPARRPVVEAAPGDAAGARPRRRAVADRRTKQPVRHGHSRNLDDGVHGPEASRPVHAAEMPASRPSSRPSRATPEVSRGSGRTRTSATSRKREYASAREEQSVLAGRTRRSRRTARGGRLGAIRLRPVGLARESPRGRGVETTLTIVGTTESDPSGRVRRPHLGRAVLGKARARGARRTRAAEAR